MQSIITSLYWDNFFVLSPIALDDTVMTGLRDLIYISGIAQQFEDAGFDYKTMACHIIPYGANFTGAQEPILNITKDYGLNLTG